MWQFSHAYKERTNSLGEYNMLGYIHKDTTTGCLIPVTTAGPVGGTVEKLEYGCDKNYALPLTETTAGEGYVGISCECPIYYNPVSGLLTVENICGNITNADIAERVSVTNTNTNTTYAVPLICDCHIYKGVNNTLTFNPAVSQLTVDNGSICVTRGPNCSLINGDCIATTCVISNDTNFGTVNANTVIAPYLCGTATWATYADAISDCTVIVKAQCNNELNMTPNAGCTFWISYRGGTSEVCIGNGTGNGGLGDVYAANFYGSVACARQVCNSMSAGNEANLVYAEMADNDQFRIRVGGGSNDGWAEIATADDGSEPIYVRQYTGVFSTVARTATLLNSVGNTDFPGIVDAGNGVRANKNGQPADTVVAGFCTWNYTNGAGYTGGAYVGHYNPNYDGYWGYAIFGFYNKENDTLCPGICVSRTGLLFGRANNCTSGFNGSCYIPTAGEIRYYLQGERAVKASVSGCTLYLCTSSWS